MHEYSLIAALIERVEAEAAQRHADKVHVVRVRIGELAGVDPQLFATAFETFTPRTIAGGAKLEIEWTPAEWHCSACGREVPRGGPLICGWCRAPARLRQGDELILDRLEMEVSSVQ